MLNMVKSVVTNKQVTSTRCFISSHKPPPLQAPRSLILTVGWSGQGKQKTIEPKHLKKIPLRFHANLLTL